MATNQTPGRDGAPGPRPGFEPAAASTTGETTGDELQSGGSHALPGPGTGWQHGEQPTQRRGSSAQLPWVLVAMLSVLSLGLAGMLVQQFSELNRLRDQAAAPAASTSPGASAPAASASVDTAQQAEAQAVMKRLPRRQANDPLAQGPVDAPVVMVVWSDFRCPFCSVWARQTHPQLKPYVDSGSLRIEYRDLVLFGEQSMDTAIAARAAGNQGRFWQFSDAVHAVAPTSGHPDITPAKLTAFAKQAGVPDMAKWQADCKAAATRQAVEKDTTEAQQLGMSGTPFFVINTTPLSGAQPVDVFTRTLEQNGAHR